MVGLPDLPSSMCNNSRFESMPAQLGKSLVARRSNWDYTGKEGQTPGTRTRVQSRFAARTLPVQTLQVESVQWPRSGLKTMDREKDVWFDKIYSESPLLAGWPILSRRVFNRWVPHSLGSVRDRLFSPAFGERVGTSFTAGCSRAFWADSWRACSRACRAPGSACGGCREDG